MTKNGKVLIAFLGVLSSIIFVSGVDKLRCGTSKEQVDVGKLCNCKIDCRNRYDEAGCVPLDVAALNNSAMINIQEPGIGHSNQFLYNKVCRPTTCSLWGNSKPKNISKTEDSCYQLPCIKGCACNDVKLNCQNRKMYQFPRKWIVPYQLVMLRSNHFKKFPIDTSILQPWIYAIDLYDNLIDCESASQDSLKNLPNLRSLDIGRNPIKTVGKNAFFNLKNLQILKMEDANILSLHKNAFNGLKNLLSLTLTANPITELTKHVFNTLQNLEILEIREILVQQLDKDIFLNLKSLKKLTFSNSFLREVKHGTFSTTANLSHLNLRNNTIRFIHQNLFKGLNKLVFLDLSYNPIEELAGVNSKAMPLLYMAFFSYVNHKGAAISTFQNMNHLAYLDLISGYMYHVECEIIINLPRLLKLSLQGSRINTICDQAFKELRTLTDLNLSQNRIRYVSNKTFYGLFSLKKLNLNNNLLQQLPVGVFNGLNFLQTLYINFNRLHSITDAICFGSQQLSLISMNQNFLTDFDFEALRNCGDNLSYLSFSKNLISFLNVTSLPILRKLETLNLERNRIVTIHSDNNTNLEPPPRLRYINLSDNPLANITSDSFTVFRHVKTLLISDKNGNEKALYALTSLQNLYINPSHFSSNYTFRNHPFLLNLIVMNMRNQQIVIDSSKFQGLTNLKLLILSYGRIQMIKNDTFPHFPSLQALQIAHNSIKSIEIGSFARMPKLTTLSLEQNEMVDIKFGQFKSLENLNRLNLVRNKIKNIQEYAFQDLVNLKFLFLEENKLTVIHEKVFAGLRRLIELHLDSNRIEQISLSCFEQIQFLFFVNFADNPLNKLIPAKTRSRRPFPYLTTLLLSGTNISPEYFKYGQSKPIIQIICTNCRIREIKQSHLQGFSNIRRLDLGNNLITALPDDLFNLLPNIQTVQFRGNGISELDLALFSSFPRRLHVDFSYNRIHSIRNSNPEKLSLIFVILLQENLIEHIEDGFFSSFPHLIDLDLRRNRLVSLPNHLCNGTTLQKIILYINKIKKLNRWQFLECWFVKKLVLSVNEISILEPETFKDMVSLKDLRLTHNFINHIGSNTFSAFAPLQLNLGSNMINRIHEAAFGLPYSSMTHLNLTQNYLKKIPVTIFDNIGSLKQLYITDNPFSEIPDFAFQKLIRLRLLAIGSPYLTDLKEISFRRLDFVEKLYIMNSVNLRSFDSHLLRHLGSLATLAMMNCHLNTSIINTDLLKEIPYIQGLFLDGNNLKEIDHYGIMNLSNIKILSLSYTNLTTDKLIAILSERKHYMTLTLDGYDLDQTPKNLLFDMNNVQYVKMSECQLKIIGPRFISTLNHVTYLILDHNQLGNSDYLSLMKLTNLEVINLDYNNISDICVTQKIESGKLKELNLNNNQIVKLEPYCFANLPSLNGLRIKNNPLIHFNRYSLLAASSLTDIASSREYLCCHAPRRIMLCEPLPDQFSLSTCNDILSHGILRIFVWFTGALSIVGNIISLALHTRNMQKKYVIVKVLILNLSAADLLMGIYLIIIASANTYFSGRFADNHEIWLQNPACLISTFLISVSSLMSTFIMFLITLDRYLHLVYPFENYRLSYRCIIILSFLFWSISAVFAGLPSLYGINQTFYYRIHGNNAACMPGNIGNPYLLSWLLIYCSVTFIIWITICSMYAVILVTLTKSRREACRKVSLFDRIIQTKMISVVITDLLCWLPLYIILIRGVIVSELDTHLLPFVAVLSLPLNSCINPVLYTIFTETFLNHTSMHIRNILQYISSIKLPRNQSYSFSKYFFPESLRNEKISIISTSSTTEITYNFKLRLIDRSHKNCKLGWLKCYDRKDRNLWEKEKQFYYDIALRNWHISNIVECIWFEGGNKYKIQGGERFGAEIHNRLLICYALPGEDIGILSDLISSQSDFLTPESVIQIVKDIEVAFNSLKFHSIIYGNIHMDAIFIALLSQGKKITALLGDFSSTQIFDDAMPYPNFADLQMNDYSNMKQLCDELLAYCKFKILEDMATTDNSLHINNVATSYSSSDWKTAQDWLQEYETNIHNHRLRSN